MGSDNSVLGRLFRWEIPAQKEKEREEMNICIFSGRLTRDSETRYTASGTPVTNFRLAVDTGWGDNKRTEFIDCVLWKREGVAQHLSKGKPVTISGEYQTREWEDRDGNKRRSVEIVVRELEFQQGAPRGGEQQENAPRGNSARNSGTSGNDLGPAFPTEASGVEDVPFVWVLAPVVATLVSMVYSGGVL